VSGRRSPPLRLIDRVERAAAKIIYRLPASVAVRLSGEAPVVVEGQTLDPHVQLVRAMRRRRTRHHLCEPTIAAGRRRYRRETTLFQWPRTSVGQVRDLEIAGSGGALRLRHYAPEADGPAPLTVYLHGGGFTIGDLETHDEPCRILCRESGSHVLSVEYRLAPEHPFPAALDDARAVLRWAQRHAAELGADPARVAIGGDSAGGNLAAVIAIETRGDHPPAAQLLIYPATDSETERPSQGLYGASYFLSMEDRAAFALAYTGGGEKMGRDPRVSPLYAPDHSGLAPALLVVAGFDLLRDEGLAYGEALRTAGSTVRELRVSEHGHGFLHMTGVSPGARAAMAGVARAWCEVLDGASAGLKALSSSR